MRNPGCASCERLIITAMVLIIAIGCVECVRRSWEIRMLKDDNSRLEMEVEILTKCLHAEQTMKALPVEMRDAK